MEGPVNRKQWESGSSEYERIRDCPPLGGGRQECHVCGRAYSPSVYVGCPYCSGEVPRPDPSSILDDGDTR